MRISTKTVASLLLVTAVAAAVPGVSGKIPRQRFRHRSQFDRLLQRHDRKGELRAELLGMDAQTFREKLKHMSFEDIVRQRGFKTVREFRIALLGRLKDELHRRGWSFARIEHYMTARSARIG